MAEAVANGLSEMTERVGAAVSAGVAKCMAHDEEIGCGDRGRGGPTCLHEVKSDRKQLGKSREAAHRVIQEQAKAWTYQCERQGKRALPKLRVP